MTRAEHKTSPEGTAAGTRATRAYGAISVNGRTPERGTERAAGYCYACRARDGQLHAPGCPG